MPIPNNLIPRAFPLPRLRLGLRPSFISLLNKSGHKTATRGIQHASTLLKMLSDHKEMLTDKKLSSIPFHTPILVPHKLLHCSNDEKWKHWSNLKKEDVSGSEKVVDEMSVVQWNVWFDSKWLQERSEGLYLTRIFEFIP